MVPAQPLGAVLRLGLREETLPEVSVLNQNHSFEGFRNLGFPSMLRS